MSAPIATPEGRATRDPWRLPRYALRVPLLLLHLAVSLPLTLLALALPHARARTVAGERYDHRMIRWWSGTLVRIFGIRVIRRGEPLPGAVLLVANHRSWLDIELIHSQRMACFVAKSEIASWPLVGWVAGRGGTIYHRRGSTESLAAVAQVMVERLREGLGVAVFPEGGIRPGERVHTFHARIFQPAIDAGVAAQPVALRFLLEVGCAECADLVVLAIGPMRSTGSPWRSKSSKIIRSAPSVSCSANQFQRSFAASKSPH